LKNTKKLKKALKQKGRNRDRNIACLSRMKTYIKKTVKSIKSSDLELAKVYFCETQSILDSYAAKGIIHRNRSSNYKSSLSSKIHRLKDILAS
jgi:small subunit ribosomal protein S20